MEIVESFVLMLIPFFVDKLRNSNELSGNLSEILIFSIPPPKQKNTSFQYKFPSIETKVSPFRGVTMHLEATWATGAAHAANIGLQMEKRSQKVDERSDILLNMCL